MPSGEGVPLQPALAEVFAQHLGHPPVPAQVLVAGQHRLFPGLATGRVHAVEPVGRRFVRAEQPEALHVGLHHVRQVVSEGAGGFTVHRARAGHLDGVVTEVGQVERPGQQTAVGVRVGPHPAVTCRGERRQFGHQLAVCTEEFLRAVALHPRFELSEMLRILRQIRQRHLMRPPAPFGGLAVDFLRPGPALGGPKHDHRPHRTAGEPFFTGPPLDAGDLGPHRFQRGRHLRVHLGRVAALDEVRPVPVAAQQRVELALRQPRQDGRIGDLVTVQVQDRQHRSVGHRVHELVGVPAAGQRPGLGLAVADHAGHQQLRIVEGRAVGVREAVAQFTALVD